MGLKNYSINIGSMLPTDFDNAIAASFGYQDTITDGSGAQIPNPETKAQYGKKMLVQLVQQKLSSGLADPASETARESALVNMPKLG